MSEQTFPATRRAGLARMADFQARMGRHYASKRNHDFGPGDRSNVSLLSPYLRTRLLTEREVVEAALSRFSLSTAEKFVQEVCWRTYAKGWLEHRPKVWDRYCADRDAAFEVLEQDDTLHAAYTDAVEGRTGIAVFDGWMRELRETGYLHNHARMWTSSIWIHTLGLPWELGADHFLQHLVDGDPASNTHGWRWVAGLHTPGKTYLARPSNIEKYAGDRFQAELGQAWQAGLDRLAGEAHPVDGYPNPDREALLPPDSLPDGTFGLLLTEEDLHPASLLPAGAQVAAIAGAVFPDARSPKGAGEPARTFAEDALADALASAEDAYGISAERLAGNADFTQALLSWATAQNLDHIVTAQPPVGWIRPILLEAREQLADQGIHLGFLRRPWDDAFWPHATAGFFKLKKKIPSSLETMGIPA